MTGMNDATRAQVDAADPQASTWLLANAGSGKTRVLTDRVARLLLAGTDPRRILCLTYTKAAAGEMQNRLFERLGDWSMKSDGDLRAALTELGITPPERLERARTLFAAAIETPGGLKIQTIHSFCSAVLRRYPLEAGVSPDFSELDDTADRQLMDAICQDLAAGADRGAVDAVAGLVSGSDFEKLTRDVVSQTEALTPPKSLDEIRAAFGLTPHETRDGIAASVFTPGTGKVLRALLDILPTGGVNDRKAFEALGKITANERSFDSLHILEDVFLTKDKAASPFSAKIDAFPTKDLRAALGPMQDDLHDLMARVEAARPRRLALVAAEKTAALHRFAAAFLPRYEAAKAARGWLSFDDLISRTRALLNRRDVAQWVLFQLDGGIDHILVDEAQDTSPAQWDVVEKLAENLIDTPLESSVTPRTLFVVGDKKQSIYSFQGADAENFDAVRDAFSVRLETTTPLQHRSLAYSFRSSQAILDAVDEVFSEATEGLTTEEKHLAFHAALPGRVDLWPAIPKVDPPPVGLWYEPGEVIPDRHENIVLAEAIAEAIREMIDARTLLPHAKGGPRPVTPGDILILVQRRAGTPSLFEAINSALKRAGLPVAGADRLKLKNALAVKDLIALLSFLALPEDSLSLATALRSPLFGWSEDELYRLAAGRKPKFLWEEMRRRAGDYPETIAILDELRQAVDILRPYDLIERILVRHDGRRRLVGRLGSEAEDSIDEFLNLALAFEQNAVPSLDGFLGWMAAEDTTIKRQLDGSGGQIRVMTVHGSKGLEAPVVILPDTTRGPSQNRSHLVGTRDGAVFWKGNAAEAVGPVEAARDAASEVDARERERLLYVAMTRAESWLIVCGAGKPPTGSWYPRIEEALARLDATPISTPTGPGLRLSRGAWPSEGSHPIAPKSAPVTLPTWTEERAAPPKADPAPLSPSDLGGEKALPGEGGGPLASRRGDLIHLALERLSELPEAQRDAALSTLLAGDPAFTDAERDDIAASVHRVLAAPHLAPIFAPDTFAEVDVAGPIAALKDRLVQGKIDRLILEKGRVLIVDYKSNRVVPETPEQTPDGLLRQLGAYRALLAGIYPDRQIDTAILWTETATLLELPHDLVMSALARAEVP